MGRSGSITSSNKPPTNAHTMAASNPIVIATPMPTASTRSGLTPGELELGEHADLEYRRHHGADGCAQEAHALPAPTLRTPGTVRLWPDRADGDRV